VIEFLHLIGLVGVTLILVRGSIFARLRRSVPILGCAQCLGFWMGAVPSAYGRFGGPWTGWRNAIDILWNATIAGGVISLLSSLAEAILAALDEAILKLRGKA
jgi:hypothetical protein